MGEQSAWDKYTNYELAHRAPMMLHVPGMIDQSMFSDNLVEFVDILPTLVEAAGIDQSAIRTMYHISLLTNQQSEQYISYLY